MSCRPHDEMPHEGDDPLDGIRAPAPPRQPTAPWELLVGVGAGLAIIVAFGTVVWVLRHTLFA